MVVNTDSTTRGSFVLILVGILILVAVAGGAYYFGRLSSKPAVYQPQPSANVDEAANWETYTNTEAKVSFQYPLAWTVKEETPENAGYKRISIEGKEGKILIDYGTGFGGACLTGYENLNVGNAQTQACHTIKDDGSEEWSLSAMKKDGVSINNIAYGGLVTVNAPYKDNRGLVLKILTTFEFTNSGVSKEEAVSIVLGLPEVKDYIDKVKDSKVEYDHDSTDGKKLVVHVYEIKDDHTATLNWFDVDKITGQVTKEL